MALPQTIDSLDFADPLDRLDLSDDRLQAARTVDRNVLVLAGPGAGKTYLLAAHAAHLAERYSGRVIALTYTRNAARELERRIAGLVAPHAARRVVASTIHAYALDLLSVHAHRIGLGRPLRILERRDVDALAQQVASEHGQPPPTGFAAHLERLLRRRALRPEDRRGDTLLGQVLTRMRHHGELTWESCLDLAIELLRSADHVAASVRYHDPFLLLDEAQDCDAAQLELIDQIVGGKDQNHLFVAMDSNQSLYGFRDADPEYVERWASDYEPAVFDLTQNYRCAPRITALARYVLGDREKPAVDDRKGKIFFGQGSEPAKEAVYVAEQVESRINQGTPPTRIAVLARNNALLTEVKDALRERRITVRTALKNAFSLQEDAVAAVLGFLHDWVEGKPPHAGTAWVLRNVFGLADDHVRQLEIQALHSAEMHPGDLLDDQRWKDLRELHDSRPHPATLVDATARIFGIDLGEDEDLKSLAAQHRTLSRLLHRMQQGVSSESAQAQGVLVSSFHGSKGLEFDVVFIIACEDGVIPDFRSTSDEALRDEKRVLYVAMTRAANELVITCNKTRNGWKQTPCRFLPPRHHRLWTAPPA